VPEVVQALYAEGSKTGASEFTRAARLLQEFIEQLNPFPTPWGLKFAAEARGLVKAVFAQPVTEHRMKQSRQMAAWMKEWLPAATAKDEVAR